MSVCRKARRIMRKQIGQRQGASFQGERVAVTGVGLVSALGQSASVTDGRWKYIYTEANATEELYDQVHDLAELHNLAAAPQYEDRLVHMRDLLRQCAIDLGDTGLLDGDGFVSRRVDRARFAEIPVTGMGWRWY